jgi:hypothetical protein
MSTTFGSPTRSVQRLLWVAGIAFISCHCTPAVAQVRLQVSPKGAAVEVVEPAERIEDPAQLKKVFEQLVTDLAGNDFAARQHASEKLFANEQFDLPLLETALKRDNLTLEARTRLLAIARQRFFRTPRAALGFQFGGQLRDRIVVGQTFPKFDAFGKLEEGDMIVVADGFKLEGPGARPLLQSIIISHEPGEVLKLVVRRGARKLDLDITLGKFSDLEQQGGGALLEDRLSRAWRIRSQAKIGAAAEPIRVEGARAAPWGASEDSVQRKADRIMQRDANENAPQLAGGGMPRLVSNPDDSRLFEPAVRQQIMVIGGQVRFANMPFARGGFFGDVDPDQGLPPIDPKVERGQLLDARMTYDKRMGGTDPQSLPPSDPRRQDLLEIKKTRDLINKQLEALDAEADELRSASKNSDKHSAADANPANP